MQQDKKRSTDWKGGNKLSVFAANFIVYMKNPKESIKEKKTS